MVIPRQFPSVMTKTTIGHSVHWNRKEESALQQVPSLQVSQPRVVDAMGEYAMAPQVWQLIHMAKSNTYDMEYVANFILSYVEQPGPLLPDRVPG